MFNILAIRADQRSHDLGCRMHPVNSLGVKFVPVANVARHLNVLTATMLRELRAARVPMICIGTQWQVQVDELNAWLTAKHAAAKSERTDETSSSTGGIQ